MPGDWVLRHYTDDTRNEVDQDDYLVFKSDGTWHSPKYWIYSNTDDWSYLDQYGTWYYSCGLQAIIWKHDYYTNIQYNFEVDPANPELMVGYCVGPCNNGYNMALIRQ